MITKIRRKMKKLNYKPGMFFFISLFLISSTISADEVTKEFHKEYTAGTKTLDISNKYGDVVIQSWDKDQIVIDVKVTVELPDRSRAEKLLNYIDIQFNESNGMVSAKTEIDDRFNFSGWGMGSRKFSISYTVKMPVGKTAVLVSKEAKIK